MRLLVKVHGSLGFLRDDVVGRIDDARTRTLTGGVEETDAEGRCHRASWGAVERLRLQKQRL